jgi:hypothetical protein
LINRSIPSISSGISSPFELLSQSPGQVTHVLLTRSPLSCTQASLSAGPLDLHVLSTPPAFVLSQDQTLQFTPLQTFKHSPRLFITRPLQPLRSRNPLETLPCSVFKERANFGISLSGKDYLNTGLKLCQGLTHCAGKARNIAPGAESGRPAHPEALMIILLNIFYSFELRCIPMAGNYLYHVVIAAGTSG